MSTQQQHSRDRGSLFHNIDKQKPSQPDMRGDCTIAGATYDMQAWRRNEQLSLTLAPTRVGKNTYPPDAFRGALDPAPKAHARAADDDAPAPAWIGNVVGDELTYSVRAFPKQGKSGPYLSLYFETAEPSAD
jgi:hypothetical protein